MFILLLFALKVFQQQGFPSLILELLLMRHIHPFSFALIFSSLKILSHIVFCTISYIFPTLFLYVSLQDVNMIVCSSQKVFWRLSYIRQDFSLFYQYKCPEESFEDKNWHGRHTHCRNVKNHTLQFLHYESWLKKVNRVNYTILARDLRAT
ncbi:hypothetical protein DFS34DRAFT_252676 [Phlyctochytrium arcticum]|nr:hypothetical protein DFS34DRAFT_252676 [Phlyctochytrium arcticum]